MMGPRGAVGAAQVVPSSPSESESKPKCLRKSRTPSKTPPSNRKRLWSRRRNRRVLIRDQLADLELLGESAFQLSEAMREELQAVLNDDEETLKALGNSDAESSDGPTQ